MKNKLLVLLVGKSATGKDTMLNQLVREVKGLTPLVSHTTRPMRDGEVDGETYHFIDEFTFKTMEKEGKFLETTSYSIESEGRTYYYGLSKEEVNNNELAITIVNPHGLAELNNSEFRDNIVSIQIVRDDRCRLISYLERDSHVNIDEMFDRYKRDKEDFEFVMTDYMIYNNGSFIKAYKMIKELVEGEIKDVMYSDYVRIGFK